MVCFSNATRCRIGASPTPVKKSKGSNQRPKAAGQKLMLNGSFWPIVGAQTAEIGGILPTFQGGLERQVWGGQFRKSNGA